MATKKKARRAVLVMTEFRGVFFGYVDDDTKLPQKLVLKDVRNCVYWSSDLKGVLGLASNGPTSSCRIGPKVPTATLWKITGVVDCSPEAVTAWEKQPWN